jgi:hypothetical protein
MTLAYVIAIKEQRYIFIVYIYIYIDEIRIYEIKDI